MSEIQTRLQVSPLMHSLGVTVEQQGDLMVAKCALTDRTNNSVNTPHGGFMSSVMAAAAQAQALAHFAKTYKHEDVTAIVEGLDVHYLRSPEKEADVYVDPVLVASSDLRAGHHLTALSEVSLMNGGKDMAKAVVRLGYVQPMGGFMTVKPLELPPIDKVRVSEGYQRVLEAAKAKDYPTYMSTLGMVFAGAAEQAVQPGRVMLEMDLTQTFIRADGRVDPAVLISMLDAAGGLAGRTVTPKGAYTMADLRLSFYDVQAAPGPLTAIGGVIKPGSKNIATRTDVIDASGLPLATGHVNCVPL